MAPKPAAACRKPALRRSDAAARDTIGTTVTTDAVVVTGVSKSYGSRAAVDDLTLHVAAGSVFALLSRYAVKFWNQGLHQDSTILKVGEKDPLDPAFYQPLVVCIVGFILLFLTLVLMRTRTEIRARRLAALLSRERLA